MPGSKRRISKFGIFVTIISLVIIITLAGTLVYTLLPVNYNGPGKLGMLGMTLPPVLLVVAFVSVLMVFWSFEKKWRLALGSFSLSVVLGLFMSVWPSFMLWQRAKEYNVRLDLVEALLPRLNAEDTSRRKSIIYGTSPDGQQLVLDAWPAYMRRGKSPHPAIVKIHGGGWVRGSRTKFTLWNSWLNKLGYHVFDVDYRMPPPERWLDEIADVKCALGWIRSHAAEYNVDTTRIILMGYSAGANLAMLAAYSYNEVDLKASCPVAPVKIKCVINLYGPSDLNTLYATTGSGSYVHEVMGKYIGGGPGEFSERYELLSPLQHISRDAPPTISFYGDRDRVVPYQEGIALDQALRDANVPHELYILPVTDHGFDGNWTYFSTQIAREKIRLFLEKYSR